MDLTNNEVIHFKEEGCQYLQFRRLLKYDGLRHAYGIKPANYKIRTEEETEDVRQNYKTLSDCIGVDYGKLVVPNQKHTNNVKSVENAENNVGRTEVKYQETDGLVTAEKNAVLATTNADCILLLMYDPVKKVIANVHSGWRGTFQKIAVNAVKKMVDDFDCDPKDIICCICPSIRKCHFEVEKDVKDDCEKIFSYTNQTNDFIEYIGKKDGKDKWTIDTVMINKIMLKDCGLLAENIVDSGICSVCNSDIIHSYRVEKAEYGVNAAIISII